MALLPRFGTTAAFSVILEPRERQWFFSLHFEDEPSVDLQSFSQSCAALYIVVGRFVETPTVASALGLALEELYD